MVVFFESEEAMGEMESPAAVSSTELECMEMEAAEQLIQLSGSCDEDGGGGGESESGSTDSVKCRKAAAGEQRDKEVAVESTTARRCRRFGAEKGSADGDDEAVIGGDARRRPRFRSLAAIYRERRRPSGDACREAEEEERRRKRKKTARDGAGADEVIRLAACKPRRVVEA